ncbi:MAG: luciferase family protein [Pseudomonadota bacterium]
MSISGTTTLAVVLAAALGVWQAVAAVSRNDTLTAATALATASTVATAPLPQRIGTPITTSGRVPHVQRGVTPDATLVDALTRFAFALPGVEQRRTVVSLPGAKGMWLDNNLPIARPETIVAGREFAHIHTDGSLHAPLPYARALEMVDKGWGERHPWADRRAGWDGLVMIFTPLTKDQLTTVQQLIVESYNHVTGQSLSLGRS